MGNTDIPGREHSREHKGSMNTDTGNRPRQRPCQAQSLTVKPLREGQVYSAEVLTQGFHGGAGGSGVPQHLGRGRGVGVGEEREKGRWRWKAERGGKGEGAGV